MVDVSTFKPNTVYVIYIAAAPEQVWQGLTDPAFTESGNPLSIKMEPPQEMLEALKALKKRRNARPSRKVDVEFR